MKKTITRAIICIVIAIALAVIGTSYYRSIQEHTLAESVEKKSADEASVDEVESTQVPATQEPQVTSEVPATQEPQPTPEVPTVQQDSSSDESMKAWTSPEGKLYLFGENRVSEALAMSLQERLDAAEITLWHQYDAIDNDDVVVKDNNGNELNALYNVTDIPEKITFLRNGENLFVYTGEETHKMIYDEQGRFEMARDTTFEDSVFCEEHRSIKIDRTINLAYLNAKLERDDAGYGIRGDFKFNAVSQVPTAWVLVERLVDVDGTLVRGVTWVVRLCDDSDAIVSSPQEGGTSHSPQEGGTSHSPQEGGTSHSPQEGGTSHSPQEGGTSHSPQEGGTSHSPQEGGTSHSPELPQEGSTSHSPESPQEGSTSHSPESPQEGDASHSPESSQEGSISHSSESPQEGSTSHSPESPQEGDASHSPESSQEGSASHSLEEPSTGVADQSDKSHSDQI